MRNNSFTIMLLGRLLNATPLRAANVAFPPPKLPDLSLHGRNIQRIAWQAWLDVKCDTASASVTLKKRIS